MSKPCRVIVIDYGGELLKAKAWISLTGKSTQVYGLLLTKRQMSKIKLKGRKQTICTNLKELELSYKEAEALGVTQRQFTRAIDQLVAHGFLDVVVTGGAYQGAKSQYGLIDNWRKYGTADFEPGLARKMDPVKRGYRKVRRCRIA